MRALVLGLTVLFVLPAMAAANGVKTYTYEGSFEDAAFNVESAIIERGLVIDHVSHVGEMLSRTKDDVGGSKDLFAEADIFVFCSAVVSRKAIEADIANIAHCPYGIFVAQAASGGPVQIGYREMPEGAMQDVQALLDEIAQEAARP